MLESEFKRSFKLRLKVRLLGIDLDFIENKNNARSTPDLIILGSPMWVALEFKTSARAKRQPNQSYHIQRMDQKSYARFVYPSNVEEVLDELEELFTS